MSGKPYTWLAAALLAAACHRDRIPALSFEPEARPLAAPGSRDPAVEVTPSGAVWTLVAVDAAGGGHDAELRVSHDGGDSFRTHANVSRARGKVEAHGESSPLLRITRRMEFIALWVEEKRLRVARSTDFGASFSAPATAESLGAVAFFTAALGPDDALIVAYLSYGHEPGAVPGSARLMAAVSRDGGKSFASPVGVAIDVCPCCRPALAATPRGTFHIAWRGTDREDVRDVAVASSTDHGVHWSSPTIVSEDGWKIAGCPHSGPSLASVGEQLFVAWTSAADGHSRSFWSRSDDGKTFAPRSEIAPSKIDTNHPVLIESNGRMFVALQGRDPAERSGWGRSRIYVGELDGAPSTRLVAAPSGPGSALYPKLQTLAPSGLVVAWTDSSERGTSAYAARARVAPGS